MEIININLLYISRQFYQACYLFKSYTHICPNRYKRERDKKLKKKAATISLLLMIALFIIGLDLLFTSTSIGQNAGSQAIRNNGGSMDTASYEYIINSTATNYRTGGMVISLVGGFGMLLSGFFIYKEL